MQLALSRAIVWADILAVSIAPEARVMDGRDTYCELFTQEGCHAAASQNQTTRGGSGASRVSELIADITVIALND